MAPIVVPAFVKVVVPLSTILPPAWLTVPLARERVKPAAVSVPLLKLIAVPELLSRAVLAFINETVFAPAFKVPLTVKVPVFEAVVLVVTETAPTALLVPIPDKVMPFTSLKLTAPA